MIMMNQADQLSTLDCVAYGKSLVSDHHVENIWRLLGCRNGIGGADPTSVPGT
jgi:hypothetical protein